MIKINLLPRTLRKRVEPGWWRVIAVAFPVLGMVIIAAMQFGVGAEGRSLTAQRDALGAEVATLQRYVDSQTQLKSQEAELTATVDIDTALRSNVVRWSSEMGNFVERLPRQANGRALVALTSMDLKRLDPAAAGVLVTNGIYDGKNVVSEYTLKGQAASLGDITRFVDAFESSPTYGVQLVQADRKEDGSYDFTASVGVVGPAPAAPAGVPADGQPGAPGQTQPGQTQPGQTQPGQTQPGQTPAGGTQ